MCVPYTAYFLVRNILPNLELLRIAQLCHWGQLVHKKLYYCMHLLRNQAVTNSVNVREHTVKHTS